MKQWHAPPVPPAIFNQGKHWNYSLEEKKGFEAWSADEFPEKKEPEKKQIIIFFTTNLSKTIAQGIPDTLQIQKEGPSWRCISETALSSKRDGGSLGSFGKGG